MERNHELDFYKGICIILVVTGHCIQYGMGFQWYIQERYFDNALFKIIYSFHMPLFMTVSGWIFFFSTKKYSFMQIMNKKIKKLIVPAVAWPLLMSFIEWAAGKLNLSGGGYSIITLMKRVCTELWFLWAVFLCVLTVLFAEIFLADKWEILFLALFEGIIILLPDIANIKMYKFLLPFFAAGYFLHKYRINIKIIVNGRYSRPILTAVLLLIWSFTLAGFDHDTYIYTSGTSLYGKNAAMQLLINVRRWMAGFAGTGFVLLFMDSMYHIRQMWEVNKILSLIGKKSLGIYILNHYININILLDITYHNSYKLSEALWLSALIVTVCYILTRFLERHKIINIIFLGGETGITLKTAQEGRKNG